MRLLIRLIAFMCGLVALVAISCFIAWLNHFVL
jgi:hypothetical protein